MNEQINVRKRTALPYARISMKHAEGTTDVGNYHQVGSTVMIVAGRNHPWMIKLVGKILNDNKKYICIVPKYLPSKYLIITKEKHEIYSGESY